MSGGVEVRGVIAMNGRGELCFFADSRADGVPCPSQGSMTVPQYVLFMRAVEAASPRRVSHTVLDLLDPPPMTHVGARNALAAAVKQIQAAGYSVWGWDDGSIVVADEGEAGYRELFIERADAKDG